jgi:hypothetical protein
MFLLLLCLGTILAPSCPASCSPPPSSGSIRAASCHPFSRSTTAPTPFCAVAPTPSLSESGHGKRSSPSVALRPARQRMPCRAALVAAAGCQVHTQAALPQPSGSRLQTRWFPLHLLRRCHKMVLELFSYLARRFLQAQDRRRLHSLHRRGTCPVIGHRPRGWTSDLFSFQPRPELGGSLVESCLHPW